VNGVLKRDAQIRTIFGGNLCVLFPAGSKVRFDSVCYGTLFEI
jgi:hypothetical protein